MKTELLCDNHERRIAELERALLDIRTRIAEMQKNDTRVDAAATGSPA